jgi:hypothetical protein
MFVQTFIQTFMQTFARSLIPKNHLIFFTLLSASLHNTQKQHRALL